MRIIDIAIFRWCVKTCGIVCAVALFVFLIWLAWIEKMADVEAAKYLKWHGHKDGCKDGLACCIGEEEGSMPYRRESIMIVQIALRTHEMNKKYGIDLGDPLVIALLLAKVHSICQLRLDDMMMCSDATLLKDIVGMDAHFQEYPEWRLLNDWVPHHAVRHRACPWAGDLFTKAAIDLMPWAILAPEMKRVLSCCFT